MIKFLAGVLLGTLLTLAGVYVILARAVSDYVVTEKVLTSSEWENSLASLQSLQDTLSKYVHDPKPLCEVFCDRSPYRELYGSQSVNKVKTLTQDLRARGKIAFKDPGFLFDLVYVERAMAPLQHSGIFGWMQSVSKSGQFTASVDVKAEQSKLSSELAVTAPYLLRALQLVQENLKIWGELKALEQTCPKTAKAELRQSCEDLMRLMSF